MTVFFAPSREIADSDDYLSPVAMDRLPEEIILPIMAGAYARGVAEAFELLGLPAIFLDKDGRVLHVNHATKPFVGGPLQLRSQHVLAKAAADNRVLSKLIAAVLTLGAGLTSACLSQSALTIHALPLPDRLRTAGQMLRGVLIISDADDSAMALLVQRIAGSKA